VHLPKQIDLVFRFKSFEIEQSKSAMKVGTDGVLLGAWATPSSPPKHILDIGTGTGLIAIMMAQRFEGANIIGIDIDSEAVQEATLNMTNCQWYKRLSCFESSFQNANINHSFDLIVCNPPYFKNTTTSNDERRATARHTNSLSLNDIFEKMDTLLSPKGELIIVYPSENFQEIRSNLKSFGLYMNEICWVKGNEKSNVKRVLLKISKQKKTLIENQLTIEKERHQYTDEYVGLCKDFYLNL
jgi:tRNA1Val (adenine37-N6)-methyltransferase